MKAAVFNHPIKDFYSSVNRVNPGILDYLSDIIFPHESEVFNVIKNKKKIIPLSSKLNYLNKYIKNDITDYSFFKNYYMFGSIDNFNHKKFKKFQPDIIIVTSFAFCYFESFNEMIIYLKSKFKLPVICGGAGPSSYPEYYLKHSDADYVIAGPAEISLKNLLDNISKNKYPVLDNVFHKNNMHAKLSLKSKYNFKPFIFKSKGNKNCITLQVTRGCPKKCSYCSIHFTSGYNYLKCSVKEIINEIKKVKINRDNVHFNFEDDSISYDKEYLLNILEEIKKNYKNASFSAENGIDLMTLNKLYIKKLDKLGFNKWNVSITSIDDIILTKTRRNYTVNKFDLLLSELENFDSLIIVYFISGLPDDSTDNILNTIIYLAGKRVLIGISNFYPVPNTIEAEKIKKDIIPVLSKGTSFYHWSKYKAESLITFFMLSRFINSIKNILINEWDLFRKNVIIKNKELISEDNLTHKELTMIGILYSIFKKNICYIYKKGNNYKINKYKLDNKILNSFFEILNKNLVIINKNNECINNKFWRKMCKKVFL